jgi:carbon monoxide dehydrogenase subunit G
MPTLPVSPGRQPMARAPVQEPSLLCMLLPPTVEEADREAWRAQMRAEANDRRLGGGIRARLSLALAPAEAGARVRIDTDLAVLGRIGEFGQPVIRKKADALLEEFARNLRAALAA